jgi:hypothetical protein
MFMWCVCLWAGGGGGGHHTADKSQRPHAVGPSVVTNPSYNTVWRITANPPHLPSAVLLQVHHQTLAEIAQGPGG